ncbi:MAG: SDR family NAD(P)-dependent oxidoreductase [Lachnospiraceae bacterium]|nr:SDR family NAD(P)-dependent oxidoreductase [Lachnospiraceae bacterium]
MIAIVTGASSGIGYEVCAQLRDLGYTVYGLSRRGTAPEGVSGRSVDVTDEAAVRACVDEIAAKEGRIDVLVAGAGMGISGPIEMTAKEDARYLMEVNFYGQFYAAKAVLPYMRKQGSGQVQADAQAQAGETSAKSGRAGSIVFISSVAAPIAIPYQSFYSASKSAVNSLALALRNEVRDYGIRVSAVMPGDSGTGFTDARKKTDGGDAYPRCERAVASMEHDERNGIAPSKVASIVIKAATKKNPAPLYVAGFKYRLLLGLYNILPTRLAVWLVGKVY